MVHKNTGYIQYKFYASICALFVKCDADETTKFDEAMWNQIVPTHLISDNVCADGGGVGGNFNKVSHAAGALTCIGNLTNFQPDLHLFDG